MHEAYDRLDRDEAVGGNPWGLDRARVISLVSQKGGVGKTTSTVNIGAAFALCGHRVLVMGIDPQCGVSRSLGFRPGQLRGGLREVILSGLPLKDVAHETALEDLHMVVPDAWSLDEEREYKGLMEQHPDIFVEAVTAARGEWDTILMDCPPGFGPETRAALRASDAFLVPVQAEELSRASLERLLDFVRDYAAAVDMPSPELEGLFMTMTDHRTRMSRHVANALDADYGDDLLDHAVPRTTRLAEMALQGRPTVIYDRRSVGSRAYFDMVDEIMLRWLQRPEIIAMEAPAASNAETAPLLDDVEPVAAAAAAGGPDVVFGAGLPADDHLVAADPSPPADEGEDVGSGIAKLLRDITGRSGGSGGGEGLEPSYAEGIDEASASPDMVSLDELLAEEEAGDKDERDGYWGLGDDEFDTIN